MTMFKSAAVFPFLLVVLVWWRPGDSTPVDTLSPIVTRSQERKICVELCGSALGGSACGQDCMDLVPEGLTVMQSDGAQADQSDNSSGTRRGACELLCGNGLGMPLCSCGKEQVNNQPDFFKVCSYYCLQYNYRINGCQKCDLYNLTASAENADHFQTNSLLTEKRPIVNWDLWCLKKCQIGDGGAACNCDLLPMSLII